MRCSRPIVGYQTFDGAVFFQERRGQGDYARTLQIACGQCWMCRLERSRQWAVRIMHEASLHDVNSFVTFTYKVVPPNGSLRYEDYQRFQKRLGQHLRRERARSLGVYIKDLPRELRRGVRFYMCGEYGEENFRPHYHACLFGFDPADKYQWRKSKAGFPLYRSALLEKLWPHGSVEVGALTFESAAYVARYVMKKITGDAAPGWYNVIDPDTGEVYERAPEFTQMSLKPGIGAQWIDKFRADVYPHGKVVMRGREMMPPKYYERRHIKEFPEAAAELELLRLPEAKAAFADSSPERLAVKEQVAKARAAFSKRS